MTSLTLKFVPIEESMHVYLNGIEQFKDTDWTWDGAYKVTALSPMDARSGDKLECLYAHLGVQADVILGSYVTRNYGGSFSNTTATLVTYAHTAGNLLIGCYAANSADITTTPGDGWTHIGSASNAGHIVRWYFKVGNGSTSSVSPALSGLTWYNWTVLEFGNGLTSVAEVVMLTGSGTSHTSPATSNGGRILHSFALAPGNNGYSISGYPPGDTVITATSWGNGDTLFFSHGVDTNAASIYTSSVAVNSITSTLALA